MPAFSLETLKLISSIRGIANVGISRPLRPVVTIESAIEKCFKQVAELSPQKDLGEIQNLWASLISPISTEMCSPYKLDSRNCLWIQVKNSVLRQHLQFQETHLLTRLKPFKVASLRWKIR